MTDATKALLTDDAVFDELARDTLSAWASGIQIDMDTTGLGNVNEYDIRWEPRYIGCPRCCIGAHLAHDLILRDPNIRYPGVQIHLALEYGRSVEWARGLVVGTMPRNLGIRPLSTEVDFQAGLLLGQRLLEWVVLGMPADVLA